MVAPVPAQISKLRTRLPAAARRRSSPLLTTHNALHTVFLSPLCFHTLTNPFSCNPFLFTSIQHPPGCGLRNPKLSTDFSVRSVPLWQIHLFQELAASLSSLCTLFRTRFLCFQSFAASFPKTPGVGTLLDGARWLPRGRLDVPLALRSGGSVGRRGRRLWRGRIRRRVCRRRGSLPGNFLGRGR